MLAERNLGLGISRTVEIGSFTHAFVTINIMCLHSISLKEVNSLCPLRVQSEDTLLAERQLRPNLATAFRKAIAISLNLSKFDDEGLPKGVSPEDIFHYIYAVLHSPTYRTRYAEFLKIDFPRIPLPGSPTLFRDLAALGGELVALHLLEAPKLDTPVTQFVGDAKTAIGRVAHCDGTVWIDAPAKPKGGVYPPRTTGFRGVPETVWNFHVGGYQVCEKWLKDRKGRTLSPDDIAHYGKIVVALGDTIRLMGEIDGVVERHGGWPEAFHSPAPAE